MTTLYNYLIFDKLSDRIVHNFYGANDRFAKRILRSYFDKNKELIDETDLVLYCSPEAILLPDSSSDLDGFRVVN